MKKKSGPRYLMWYDDNPKIPLVTKITEAIEAYTQRFAIAPNVVLVNQSQLTEYKGVEVRGVEFVRRNNFWVGLETPIEVRETIPDAVPS